MTDGMGGKVRNEDRRAICQRNSDDLNLDILDVRGLG